MLLTVRAAWGRFSFYNTPSGSSAVAHYPTVFCYLYLVPTLRPGGSAVKALNLQEAWESTAMPPAMEHAQFWVWWWTPFSKSHFPTLTHVRAKAWLSSIRWYRNEEGLSAKHCQQWWLSPLAQLDNCCSRTMYFRCWGRQSTEIVFTI